MYGETGSNYNDNAVDRVDFVVKLRWYMYTEEQICGMRFAFPPQIRITGGLCAYRDQDSVGRCSRCGLFHSQGRVVKFGSQIPDPNEGASNNQYLSTVDKKHY